MAITNTIIQNETGIEVPNAYIHLSQVFWSNLDKSLMATFLVFVDETARREGKKVLTKINLNVSDLIPNLEDVIYAKLKEEQMFSTAIDVENLVEGRGNMPSGKEWVLPANANVPITIGKPVD